MPHWKPGDRVERYQLEKLLGQGGFGEVWLAVDSALGRRVAIKTLVPQVLSPMALDSFRTEARSIARLEHPGIIQIFDIGQTDDCYFIVMEYVEGTSLAGLIKTRKISLRMGLDIAIQVSRALAYLHRNGIVHRDIKPANILISLPDPDSISLKPVAKIGDLGLATDIIMGAMDNPPKKRRLIERKNDETVAERSWVGTPLYMSPELFAKSPASFLTDMYSVGVTFYELFTGTVPRASGDLDSLIKLKAQAGFANPTDLNPEIPKGLADLVIRMVSPSPEKRPQSMTEVVKTLEEILAGLKDLPATQAVTQKPVPLEETVSSVTQIASATPPSGFFESDSLSKSHFFPDDTVRYTKIQETLKFYRDHLNDEYQNLLRQAKLTFWLWLGCVSLGFCALLGGIVSLLMGHITQGVASSVGAMLVYFIQRIFQQREDHYRSLASAKNAHLEYGNQWLLIIQSIDAIQDPTEQKSRQGKLVEVLTQKLSDGSTRSSKNARGRRQPKN